MSEHRLLTIEDVSDRFGGRHRNQILRDVKSGLLPPPVKLAGGAHQGKLYWISTEVDAAIEKIAAEAQRRYAPSTTPEEAA